MKVNWLRGLVFLLCFPSISVMRAQTRPAPQPSPPSSDELFLSYDDIARVQRALPAVVEASHKGRAETSSVLARQEMSFRKLTQVLSNLSVAYSSIVFDEWMKEVQAQFATGGTPGEYTKRIEQARQQIEQITSRHQKAQKGGRSALAVNKEIVAGNRAAVEEIMNRLRDVAVENLPQDPAVSSPPSPE